MMDNKNKKKLIVVISGIVLTLIGILVIILKDTPNEPFNIRDSHEAMLKEGQELIKEKNKVSEVVPIDNSNMEIDKTITYEDTEVSTEKLKDAIEGMERETKKFDFSNYQHIEDLTDYSKYEHIEDLIAGEPTVVHTQQYYFDEIADTSFKQMRLTFGWLNTKVEPNEYHLYNDDMSLEYMPVEEEPGSIVYIIEDVSEGDVFCFYLDAPYLSGVYFIQEEQSVIDSMQFQTDEDILNYYGDWILDEEEYQ